MTTKKSVPQQITLRYLPKRLTRKDRKKQASMLMRSRKLYKQGKYFTRKKLASFVSRKSSHITDAQKMYNVKTVGANPEFAKKTGCSTAALTRIIKKGEGAYASSGSRPNQTPQSWGIARLASSVTGGKAAAVDFNILQDGCKPSSKALKLAKKAKAKYGYGKHRVPKTNL